MEFGAGRGKLSHWIHEALKAPQQQQEEAEFSPKEPAEDLQLLLVERSSTRFKAGGPALFLFTFQSASSTSDGAESHCLLSLLQVDGKHQQGGDTLERLQVDIQHLHLGGRGFLLGGVGILQVLTSDFLTSASTAKVPLLQQKKLPLVAVGKHLCGAATGECERRPLIGY